MQATSSEPFSYDAFSGSGPNSSLVAYFSMEIAIKPDIPTYSGGLGVLAGDTLRSMADLGVPAVAFSLVYHKGFFKQELDIAGVQTEKVDEWTPAKYCNLEKARVTVSIENRVVTVRCWRYDLKGRYGHVVPIYLLDTDLEENTGPDRWLTDQLYSGDENDRLRQEIVLGMGGVRMAHALGYQINVHHMNEGHAALLTLALLESELGGGALGAATDADTEQVRKKCVFTTHTPVEAGHDRFTYEQTERILGKERTRCLDQLGYLDKGILNMTLLALHFSRYANGVAMKHAHVSRDMFPNFTIDSITNGVHTPTWVSEPFQQMLDEHIPAWRRDNLYLRNAIELPEKEILAAHARNKEALLAEVASHRCVPANLALDPRVLTLGFARRAATYKRATLLLSNPARLLEIANKVGGLQIIYAGKAHPQDNPGKDMIQQVVTKATALNNNMLRIIYLENYNWKLGALLNAGVDVWVNTPQRPREASGTSGMKAALNGVPSLSILDGWWIEGCIEGVTGWAIESSAATDKQVIDAEEAQSLYHKLETAVVPLFLDAPEKWARLMRTTLAFNGSFFNTNRMVKQYTRNAYFPQKLI
jgi:starch phosphorylase